MFKFGEHLVLSTLGYIIKSYSDKYKTTDLGQLLRRITINELSIGRFKRMLDDLLQYCKDQNISITEILNSQDNNPETGYTAAHLAFNNGKLDFLSYLFEIGARYDIPDRRGRSVLNYFYLQLKESKDSINPEIFNIVVNAICRNYGYTIKGHFNGVLGIHRAVLQAEQEEEQYLLRCYIEQHKIPDNVEKLYPYTMKEEEERAETEAHSQVWPGIG